MVRRSDIITQLKEYRNKLQKKLGEVKIVFFGSYARGNYNKDSDVDLIVVSPYFRGIKSFERSQGLRDEFGVLVPMDIICLTPEEFDEKKNRITIVAEAVKEGIVIG